jgi:plasmid stabilization system protein ParE
MKYSVSLSHQAEADLARAHGWWSVNHSVERANRWYASFFRGIPTLEENPFRYAKIAESPIFPIELRQFNFGTSRKPTHRAVFTVRSTEVIVVRVRHLAQQSLTEDDPLY